MVDVFISYKQEEREAVQIIADALSELKLDIWFDTKLRSGGSFDEEIAAALAGAKAVLVCWTPAAIKSDWVRSEATEGLNSNRLAACILQPTALIPPFTLVHAENLSAWAGQNDDRGWMALLDRIGELTGRPGIATYNAVMRPQASVQELKGWANTHADDPLSEEVWKRIAAIEGESAVNRNARARAEERASNARRRAQSEKSRRLARERGLRDPVRERRRFLALVGAVALLALISVGAIAYFGDAQARERHLNDAHNAHQVRAFLRENGLHPITALARARLASLDQDDWNLARSSGTITALQGYITEAQTEPRGAYLSEATAALAEAQTTQQVQQMLSRLFIYRGDVNGAKDEATRTAIRTFRYRWSLQVSDAIDRALLARLRVALDVWIHPSLEDFHAESTAEPSEGELVALASTYNVDGPSFLALARVETGTLGGFAADGRPIILFERHLFSRSTGHRYDATHPNVSNPSPGGYPPTQDERWQQLAEAFSLDRDAALRSTSFGKFSTLGRNFSDYGFATVGEYVRYLSQKSINQYDAELRFARVYGLLGALRRHDWVAVARGFNGPNYSVNQYDSKLSRAYEEMVAEFSARYSSLAPGVTVRGSPRR